VISIGEKVLNKAYAVTAYGRLVIRRLFQVVECLTSGVQLVFLIAFLQIAPIIIIYIGLLHPLLGLALTFLVVFGFSCVTRSRWR